MNLNIEEKGCVYLYVCACVLVTWDSFWFGGGMFFQTFIYLTLVFHFSVPDNRPMILVTSSTSQATYPGSAEGAGMDFWGQSHTNSVSLPPPRSKSSPFLGQLWFSCLLTWFP